MKKKTIITMKVNRQGNMGIANISFSGALGLLFIALKLTGYINWSWWYVTMPLWLLPAVALLFAGFCLVMAGLVVLLEKK